jgi:hypothetical protein
MLPNIPVQFQWLRLASGGSAQHVRDMGRTISPTKRGAAPTQGEGSEIDVAAAQFIQQTGSKRGAIGAVERFKKAGPIDRGSAEIDRAAAQFITLAGSKRAAIRAIKSARSEFKGRRRGSRGLHHLQADGQVLWLAYCLQACWHPRKISRSRAIEKITDLFDCQLDEAAAKKLLGDEDDESDPGWEPVWGAPSVAKLLGCADYRPRGTKDSILRRLARRKLFAGVFMGDSSPDLEVGVTLYGPPAAMWAALDRLYPDLHLLPPGSTGDPH